MSVKSEVEEWPDLVERIEDGGKTNTPVAVPRPRQRRKPKFTTPKEVRLFICCLCEYKTPYKPCLTAHLMSHTGERPFKCDECDSAFKTNAGLNQHKNIHAGIKPYKCGFCPKAFASGGEQIRHERFMHTKVKPHKCKFCDYASVMKRHLANHVFSCHSWAGEDKKYQCKKCDFVSGNYNQITTHLRKHKNRSYDCEACGRKFDRRYVMTNHKCSGTPVVQKEAKYKCPNCNSGFKSHQNQKKHLRLFHNLNPPIRCKHCDESFTERWDFKKHIQMHGIPFCIQKVSHQVDEKCAPEIPPVKDKRNLHPCAPEIFPVEDERKFYLCTPEIPQVKDDRKLHPCATCSRTFRTTRQLNCHKCINFDDFTEDVNASEDESQFEKNNEIFESELGLKCTVGTIKSEDKGVECNESSVKIQCEVDFEPSVKNEVGYSELSVKNEKDFDYRLKIKNEGKNVKFSIKTDPDRHDSVLDDGSMDDWTKIDRDELDQRHDLNSQLKLKFSDDEFLTDGGGSSPEL